MADDGLVLNLSFNEPPQRGPSSASHQQQHRQKQPGRQHAHVGPKGTALNQSRRGGAPGPGSHEQEPAPPADGDAERSRSGAAAGPSSRDGGAASWDGSANRKRGAAPASASRGRGVLRGRGGGGGGRGPGRGAGGGGRGAAAAATPGDEDAGGPAIRGADDSEDDDVAAMVAAVSKRDQQLEQDLSRSGHGQRRHAAADSGNGEGVVEFGDAEDEDEGRGAKRRKLPQHQRQQQQQQQPAGAQAGDKVQGKGQQQAEKPTILVPGQLGHRADQAPGAASAQVFGSDPTTWEGLGLDPRLAAQLTSSNFQKPTRCQQESIPVLLAGKDALVKAPTGSGKTLAYLVPIINDLTAQSPRISRAEGTYAVVVAPTRELCLQIQDVALVLLRRFPWLVSSVLIGGENRAHEKARLRKGVTLVVATPGRLQDHLDHTASFRTGELRWLVLDEADRLLDLGFQEKLREIISVLDQRTGKGTQPKGDIGEAEYVFGEGRRRTVLLSATLHQALGALATEIQYNPVPVGFAVKQGPSGLHVADADAAGGSGNGSASAPGPAGANSVAAALSALPASSREPEFTIPSQLRQAFVEVPSKDRLMALAGVLRQKLLRKSPLVPGAGKPTIGGPEKPGPKSKGKGKLAAEAEAKAAAALVPSAPASAQPAGRKVVVFVSSCDCVDLHHQLLGSFWAVACGAPLFDVPLLKLHGDMLQQERTAAFVKFCQAKSAVLICTDVAARGLDFPDVTNIVQYDAPGAPEEYVHRVGRTARMGHSGEALIFLMPHERPYVDLLAGRGIALQEEALGPALKWLPPPPDRDTSRHAGNTSAGSALAFSLQRTLMSAVAGDAETAELAANAFRSFVRAYATHPKDVKAIFNVRQLHLGHVAFAFGLKDTPMFIGQSGSSAERKRKKHEAALAAQKQAKKKLYTAAQHTANTATKEKPVK